MRTLTSALLMLFLLLPATARADLEQSFQSWNMLMLSGRLDPSTRTGGAVWLDLQSRHSPLGTQVLVRPGLGLYLTPQTSLWAGHLLSPTFLEDGTVRIEHRPWQQLQSVIKPWDDMRLLLRTRFEQRFMGDQRGVGLRLRQMVRVQQRLAGDFAGVAWGELFLAMNQTSWSAPPGMDATRWFGGAAWMLPTRRLTEAERAEGRWNARARLEAGYLGHIAPRPDATTVAHAASVNLFIWW